MIVQADKQDIYVFLIILALIFSVVLNIALIDDLHKTETLGHPFARFTVSAPAARPNTQQAFENGVGDCMQLPGGPSGGDQTVCGLAN